MNLIRLSVLGLCLIAASFGPALSWNAPPSDDPIPRRRSARIQFQRPAPTGQAVPAEDVTGSTALATVRSALRQGRQTEVETALATLTRRIESNPEVFRGVVTTMQTETDPDMRVLLTRFVADHAYLHPDAVTQAK